MPRQKIWSLKDASIEHEIIHEIENANDRASAVIAAEFLSQRIKEALCKTFKDDWKERDEALFEGQGPLADFSSRINMARALGILGCRTQRDLHLIRKVRNDFAHVISPTDFSTVSIASRCRELKIIDEISGPFRPPRRSITEPRDRYLSTISFVMSRLLAFVISGKSSSGLSDLP